MIVWPLVVTAPLASNMTAEDGRLARVAAFPTTFAEVPNSVDENPPWLATRATRALPR